MSIAERARELAKLAYWKAFEFAEHPANGVLEIADLIEQALLAERRLAMEEAQKIATMRVKHQPYENCRECELVRDVIIDLRAAAEKEVGK